MSIACILAKAKTRPKGYTRYCKKVATSWNEDTGKCSFTEEALDHLLKKYAGTTEEKRIRRRKRRGGKDYCKYAMPACCGNPDVCGFNAYDCLNPKDLSCKLRGLIE